MCHKTHQTGTMSADAASPDVSRFVATVICIGGVYVALHMLRATAASVAFIAGVAVAVAKWAVGLALFFASVKYLHAEYVRGGADMWSFLAVDQAADVLKSSLLRLHVAAYSLANQTGVVEGVTGMVNAIYGVA
jgi:hypothetical protein